MIKLLYTTVVLTSVIPRPVASTPSGNLSEMEILSPNARPTESETMGVRASYQAYS